MTKYEHYKLTKLEKPHMPHHKEKLKKKKENDQNKKKIQFNSSFQDSKLFNMALKKSITIFYLFIFY